LPPAVRVVEAPSQILVLGVTVTVIGVTVTVTDRDEEQLPLVPETVYVVVVAGLAVTDAPEVEDKPLGGDQE
jgi:hypothetical protein